MKKLIVILTERLKNSLTKPNEIFKYKNDSIEITIKYIFFIIAFLALLIFILFLAIMTKIIPDSYNLFLSLNVFSTIFFASLIFEIGLSLILFSGIISAIIYLFSNNPDKNLQQFFKINCYIIGCAYIQSGIFFIFLFFLSFLSFIVFLLPIMTTLFSFWILSYTVFSLVYAYKNAENY